MLRDLLKAVEENVDGSWSGWDSVEHICDTYNFDIKKLSVKEVTLINDCIKTDGAILTVETIQRFGLNG